MDETLALPIVTNDFDGQTFALDAAIRTAAAAFNFQYEADAPTFVQMYHVPDLVYKLVQHYTMRGFTCLYDGDLGKLKINWAYPNMSWLEQREITRAVPELIPNLGVGFRASMLYLCMTNGTDLRDETDITLQSKLIKQIAAAATLGNLYLTFGFPSVPAPAIQNLFAATFTQLQAAGFTITYNSGSNIFLLRWSETVPVILFADATLSMAFA